MLTIEQEREIKKKAKLVGDCISGAGFASGSIMEYLKSRPGKSDCDLMVIDVFLSAALERLFPIARSLDKKLAKGHRPRQRKSEEKKFVRRKKPALRT